MTIGHRIIEPQSAYWTPFYVIRFVSEAHADQVRSNF